VTCIQQIIRRKIVVPRLKATLEANHKQKKEEIDQLTSELDIANPKRLRQVVTKFNDEFLAEIRKFHEGQFTMWVQRMTWEQEMADFDLVALPPMARKWKERYFIEPHGDAVACSSTVG